LADLIDEDGGWAVALGCGTGEVFTLDGWYGGEIMCADGQPPKRILDVVDQDAALSWEDIAPASLDTTLRCGMTAMRRVAVGMTVDEVMRELLQLDDVLIDCLDGAGRGARSVPTAGVGSLWRVGDRPELVAMLRDLEDKRAKPRAR
jgi:hypothetical protein